MIFDKLRDEGFVPATEEVRLTVEILVPSSQVGRIIGRGGSNVRELQRVTGSIIKLPTQGSTDGTEDTTTVHIIGHFLATQVNKYQLIYFDYFIIIVNTFLIKIFSRLKEEFVRWSHLEQIQCHVHNNAAADPQTKHHNSESMTVSISPLQIYLLHRRFFYHN